jgi:hypothetical protein
MYLDLFYMQVIYLVMSMLEEHRHYIIYPLVKYEWCVCIYR